MLRVFNLTLSLISDACIEILVNFETCGPFTNKIPLLHLEVKHMSTCIWHGKNTL